MNSHLPLFAAEPVEPTDTTKTKTIKQETELMPQLHRYAQEKTPTDVSVPHTLTGLAVWAFGQYGPWVLFVVSTWLLYNDTKATQAQLLEVTKSQIAVNVQVVSQMAEVRTAISMMAEEAKNAHRSK